MLYRFIELDQVTDQLRLPLRRMVGYEDSQILAYALDHKRPDTQDP